MTALPQHRRSASAPPETQTGEGLDSHILLRAFCDELARCGLRIAATAPGSRNTPILLALAREPRIRCFSHLDERCAGFFALGAARAGGRPTAVTCTSGTAAANLFGAVIEAHEARVPLIVLTADRPPELREVGAGQTIDQLKLYGDAVKWFFELDLGTATPQRLSWVRALACRAYFLARDGRAGPVHLNVPLREPLAPGGPLTGEPAGGRPGGEPWVTIRRAGGNPARLREPDRPRTVWVAGRLGDDPALGPALARAAARAGIPLLADPLSGARRGEAAIAHYDLLLREPRLTAALVPQAVYRIGELPTSKPLRSWLSGLSCPQVAVACDEAWFDPDATLARREVAPIAALLEAPSQSPPGAEAVAWLRRWQAADRAVAGALRARLFAGELSEPAVAALLGEELAPETTLWVASSMPVRDVESFFCAREDPPRVLSNRGANGIDGTVSSALGAAAVTEGPVVLLIGDVALAHDLGGMLAARREGLDLTVVLVNNDGGGIFHFLPVAGERDAFEQHVATPHGLRFEHAAALFGWRHERPRDLQALRGALSRGVGSGGATIIEICTERRANLELHRLLERAARAALASALAGSDR